MSKRKSDDNPLAIGELIMQISFSITVTTRNGQPLEPVPQYVASVDPCATTTNWQIQIHDKNKGMDTVEANEKLGFKADARDYTVGVQILADLGIKRIRLMTNNPKKIEGLEKYGIKIVKRVPLIIKPTTTNKRYLKAKQEKLGHHLEDKGIVK